MANKLPSDWDTLKIDILKRDIKNGNPHYSLRINITTLITDTNGVQYKGFKRFGAGVTTDRTYQDFVRKEGLGGTKHVAYVNTLKKELRKLVPGVAITRSQITALSNGASYKALRSVADVSCIVLRSEETNEYIVYLVIGETHIKCDMDSITPKPLSKKNPYSVIATCTENGNKIDVPLVPTEVFTVDKEFPDQRTAEEIAKAETWEKLNGTWVAPWLKNLPVDPHTGESSLWYYECTASNEGLDINDPADWEVIDQLTVLPWDEYR